jgi:hypothetical protein
MAVEKEMGPPEGGPKGEQHYSDPAGSVGDLHAHEQVVLARRLACNPA